MICTWLNEVHCWFCNTFKIGDQITILGLIVNSLLAYWIVSAVQSKLANKRVIKDYYICELKEIRSEYKTFLNQLFKGSICLLYTSPSPRDGLLSRMPSSA